MTIALLVDFDGTVTATDSSEEILKEFAVGDWRSLDREGYEGKSTLVRVLREQGLMVREERSTLERFLLDNIEIREGFADLARWCRERGIYLEICSDGFGFAIEILLEKWDLGWIPWTSNRATPTKEGIILEFPHMREDCPVNANCKCSHLERLMFSHENVIFIGDGMSDMCVARKASTVFARGRLAQFCDREGIRHMTWDGWDEIQAHVRDLL